VTGASFVGVLCGSLLVGVEEGSGSWQTQEVEDKQLNFEGNEWFARSGECPGAAGGVHAVHALEANRNVTGGDGIGPRGCGESQR
jgi:hypothetical protein